MSGNARAAEAAKQPQAAHVLPPAANGLVVKPALVPPSQRHRFAAISPAPPVVQRTVDKISGLEFLVQPQAPALQSLLSHWKGKRFGAVWKMLDHPRVSVAEWQKVNDVGESLIDAVSTARNYVLQNRVPAQYRDVPHYSEYQRLLIPGQKGSKHMVAGYVIEEIAARRVKGQGLTYQDTGAVDRSRPDFAMRLGQGQLALFDVTSHLQKGHILGKADWLAPIDNVFSMEVMYRSLSLEGVKTRLSLARVRRVQKQRLKRELQKYLESDEGEYFPPGERLRAGEFLRERETVSNEESPGEMDISEAEQSNEMDIDEDNAMDDE